MEKPESSMGSAKWISGVITGLFTAFLVGNLVCMAVNYIDKQRHPARELGENTFADYTASETTASARPAESNDPLQKLDNLVDGVSDVVDTYTGDHSLLAEELVTLSMWAKRLSGIPVEELYTWQQGKIALLEDGHMTTVNAPFDYAPHVESVAQFAAAMKDKGIPFLYLETPYKQMDNAGRLYADYKQTAAGAIRADLRAAGVPLLSLPELVAQRGMDNNALFFKSDHHWLPQSGLWATGLLARWLNDNAGYSVDTSAFDLSNYAVSVLDKSFMGSHGEKATTAYIQPDDFPVVLPNYATNLTVYNSLTDETTTGTVEETLFDAQAAGRYPYYGYSDRALLRITNNTVKNGKRLLVIKNSMANVMYPYLATQVEHMDVIDLRAFDGSLTRFMAENPPDTVVMIYGVGSYCWSENVEESFDFR